MSLPMIWTSRRPAQPVRRRPGVRPGPRGHAEQGGDVPEQRVEPDVHGLRGVARKLNSPLHRAPGDGKVLQPALHPPHHLVPPGLRHNEVGVRPEDLLELVLVTAQPEKVILLAPRLTHGLVDRAHVTLQHVPFRLVLLASNAVVALVPVLVDVAILPHPLDHPSHELLVAVARRPHEGVILNVQRGPQVSELGGHLIHVLRGSQAARLRRHGDLLSVLVRPRHELHLPPSKSVVPRQCVCCHSWICASHVRRGVRVVARRGHGEGVGHG